VTVANFVRSMRRLRRLGVERPARGHGLAGPDDGKGLPHSGPSLTASGRKCRGAPKKRGIAISQDGSARVVATECGRNGFDRAHRPVAVEPAAPASSPEQPWRARFFNLPLRRPRLWAGTRRAGRRAEVDVNSTGPRPCTKAVVTSPIYASMRFEISQRVAKRPQSLDFPGALPRLRP
jgi:hypothetical protein